jgi:4-cresol dehydrogenase (hydroxylating)
VLGNALERGVGYTPFGDHAAQLCGLEVVLANGEVIRTGMGAMEGNRTWPLYQGAFGPSLDGLFLQSNFGVVTKAGIWLMPEPDSFSVVELMFPREEDIVGAVDALRALRLDGTVATATIANWMRIAAANTTRAEWHDGKGVMPPEVIEKLIAEMGIGHWNMRFGLYGRRKLVAENLKAVEKAFSKIERVDFAITDYLKGETVRPEHRSLAGIPSVELMPLNWLGGAGAHIECPPVVPMVGKEVFENYRRRTELFNANGFDHYCGLTTTSPRCFINTGSIIFDRNDAEQCKRARQLGAALIEDAKAKGLGGYRGHISEMNLIAKQFDFNNHAAMRVSEQLKDCLDPEGILSPGKQGIWPKQLREAGKSGETK